MQTNTFKLNWVSCLKSMLLAGVLVGSSPVSAIHAQSAGVVSSQPAAPNGAAAPYRFRTDRLSNRANNYYGLIWGVDDLRVKWAESGELVRFSWRVLDPEKAKTLHDKKATPFLIDPQAQVKLVVPSMEKVGQLRQSSTPIIGSSYWMAFSNTGRLVKRGDRVEVQIGNFRAAGLVVE